LIHPPKGPTETPTGKAGQTSSYSMPTAPTIKITRPSATRPGHRWIQAKPFVKWAAEPDPICPQAQA